MRCTVTWHHSGNVTVSSTSDHPPFLSLRRPLNFCVIIGPNVGGSIPAHSCERVAVIWISFMLGQIVGTSLRAAEFHIITIFTGRFSTSNLRLRQYSTANTIARGSSTVGKHTSHRICHKPGSKFAMFGNRVAYWTSAVMFAPLGLVVR